MDKNTWLRVLGVLVAIFLAFTLRQCMVGPPDIDPDHAFDTEAAYSRLARILGDETPHPIDTDANDHVRERLLLEIEALGFEPIVRDDFHCREGGRAVLCSRVQNVLFWVGAPGPNAVMIASHYDSVPAGPGAADDGIGVAVSLEVARILKGRNLSRPVLVLITDGEEIGLMGASSFVDKDPYAKLVKAVVSLEARGVRGAVSMFETSKPNGRDIPGLSNPVKTPVSNSLASDVYERMPNGTDMMIFLPLGVDGVNHAIGQGAAFYHTPGDNLANLDKRSVFHMGVSAIAASESFLSQSGSEPEQQWIYTDVLGKWILTIPQAWSLPLIICAGLIGLVVFMRRGVGAPVRALLLPPLALLLGVSFAIAGTAIIAGLRAETLYASAHPWALRGTQTALALLGAAIAFSLIGHKISRFRLLTSVWIWTAVIGGGLSLAVPGAAILVVPSLIVFLIALGFAWFGAHGIYVFLTMLAALPFVVIVIPVTAMGEVMLFTEYAAPFTVFTVLSVLMFMPFAVPPDGTGHYKRWQPPAACGALALIFAVCALLVPAYSASAPQGLSVTHSAGETPGSAHWELRTRDPIPDSIMTIAPFAIEDSGSNPARLFLAPAPDFETAGLDVRVIKRSAEAGEGTITVQITAPDSDVISGTFKGEGVSIKSLTINGETVMPESAKRFLCHGRTCRSLEVSFQLSQTGDASSLYVNGYRFGLGAESQELLAARPDWAMPKQWGDIRKLSKSVDLRP